MISGRIIGQLPIHLIGKRELKEIIDLIAGNYIFGPKFLSSKTSRLRFYHSSREMTSQYQVQRQIWNFAFRPFGCSLIFSSYLDGKPELWTVDPSGAAFGYRGAAAGKAKNNARTEIEKLDFENLTVKEGLKHAARIIHSVHDDVKGLSMFKIFKWKILILVSYVKAFWF